ncbi:MAG: glutathione S-transferase family protein [Planctomycetota bacterium]
MSSLVLVLGNKNFSSWSMRAWLALRLAGLPFEERLIWLDEDADREQRLQHSPAGRVPVLLHDNVAIWDSLAIAEYVAELSPDRGLWPAARVARARARALCAEMHAGFTAIRTIMPMNCRARREPRDRGPDVAAEVARVTALWEDTRREFGGSGPLLFGTPTLADAFFAPVASRFRTYAVPLTGAAAAYRDAVLDLPDVCIWLEQAAAETHELEPFASMP